MPDFLTVDPNGAGVIDCSEVKQQVALAKLVRQFERARIPNHFVNRSIVDSGKRGLITKRHDNTQRQLPAVRPTTFQSLIGVIERKLPLAVEIEPDAAYKLRTRILRAGDIFFPENHADS